jgi:cardiolipin synthase
LAWTALLAHLATVAGVVLVLFVVGDMLRRRRAPTSTTAWLLAVIFIPWAAVPAYLIFGTRKLKSAEDLKTPLALREGGSPAEAEAASLDRLVRSYGLPAALPGNRLTVCADGVDIFRRTMDVIAAAETRLHVQTFILHSDPTGKAIIEALARRAASGVEVRLLLDGIGSFLTGSRTLAPLVEAGGSVGWFLPVRPRRLLLGNLRNHRKATIADDRMVVAGGANMALEYMGPQPLASRWRDLSFLLEGPAVMAYADMFRADWRFATGEDLPPGDMPAAQSDPDCVSTQVLPSGPDVKGDPLYATLVAAALAAKRRLWIVSPYFIPPDGLFEALSIAAHKGVDVRIIVPDTSNHFLADLARAQGLRALAAEGCKIVRFTGGMVHAKIVVVDDEAAMVGSVNIDPRSLFLNFEANCVFYGPQAVRQVTGWIDALHADTTVGAPAVSRARDTVEGVARMLTPLL